MASGETDFSPKLPANFSDVIPEEWQDNYQDIAITRTSHGHDWLYGVDERGRKIRRLSFKVLDAAIASSFNQDVEARQTYNEAWEEKKGSRNQPTKAWQEWEAGFLSEYQKAHPVETTAIDPQIEQLIERVESLNDQVEGLNERLAAKDQEWTEKLAAVEEAHRQEIERLQSSHTQEIDGLRAQIEDAAKGETPTDFTADQNVKALVDGKIIEGRVESTPTWDNDEKVWKIRISAAGTGLEPTVHELRVWQKLELTGDTENAEIVDVSDNRWRRLWVRARGISGDLLTLREPSRRALAAIQTAGANRAYKISEEEYYSEETVDRGERRLGGVALFGAGAITWWLLDKVEDYYEQRHGIPKTHIPRTITETITNASPPKPPVPGPAAHRLAMSASEHTDFFNPAPGHRRTAVTLPGNLHLSHDKAGHNIIVNSRGGVVIGHKELPHGIAEGRGILSKAARALLRAKGYRIGYHRLENVNDSHLYTSDIYR